ncbi:MAG: phosphodiester glycosidase family protein [Clostridia bacterium]|nr:phosphodiester glycosidase family protein [Clostridia bacterium]
MATNKNDRNPNKIKTVAGKVLKIIGRLLACVVAVAIVVSVTLLAAIYFISRGDSAVVRDMFVTTMVDTGAMDFCAHMFLSDEEVNEILKSNEIIVPEGKTDTTLIVTGESDSRVDPDEQQRIDEEKGVVYDEDGVCLIDLKGKTYVGKLLIVKDPSRVSVAGLDKYGEGIVGKSTEQMAKDADAFAAINGGGYREMSDYRTGGYPEGRDGEGIVIINGVLKWGNLDRKYEIIGFDKNNVLHVDTMTGREAMNIGIRDAVNWGPVLVKNGEPCVIPSSAGNIGFHPRTDIGQRADGSVMLVIIDGRQAHSLGAAYEDLVEIFMRYDAVNAGNLDGGMSSYMVYKGEVITSPYMLYFNGRRTVATSFIVSKQKDK